MYDDYILISAGPLSFPETVLSLTEDLNFYVFRYQIPLLFGEEKIIRVRFS